jgi:hypothetical protein
MTRDKLTKYMGAGAAAVVLAFGAYAIGSSGGTPSGSATAAQGGGPAAAQPGQPPQSGQRPQGAPGGGRPGGGTEATGTEATKVKAAVTAKYPGTVERVLKLPDGSYLAHVISSSGEVHVLVSSDFKVTGVQQGGPPGGGGGAPPAGAPPAAAPSTGSTSSSSQS